MPSADRGERALPLRHAVALGLLQGPTELLPISSSAHTTLLAWLAGWPYARLDDSLRKSFEVALHAGAGVALAIHLRGELLRDAAQLDPRRACVIALSLAPPAIAGYALGPTIERALGEPGSIALGLAAGGAAMAVADRCAVERGREDATARDGLALGIAQAVALIPGISRNGAALTAARARGFEPAVAQRLSWHAGLPVILGASVLKGARARGGRVPRAQRAVLAAGGAGAFLSTLVSARLLRRQLREGQALWPYSLYRCLLAALVLARLRRAAY
jgi:undecaprenyl-diphosphatase